MKLIISLTGNEMKRSKTAGFGLVGILVVILAFGVLGLVGWRVYDAQQSKPVTIKSQSQPSSSQSKRVGADDSILDPTDFIEPYVLPAGWKEKECHEAIIAIVPPNTYDPDCAANQPGSTISMYIADNYNQVDPESCVSAKSKFDKPSSVGFKSYDCSEVTVDNNKGIRQVLEENDQGFSGEATTTTYIFPASGKLLKIEYMDTKSLNQPDYLADFDTFVKSLNFK